MPFHLIIIRRRIGIYVHESHSDIKSIAACIAGLVNQDADILDQVRYEEPLETEKILEKSKLKQHCHSFVRIACWSTHMKSPQLSFEKEKRFVSLLQKIK